MTTQGHKRSPGSATEREQQRLLADRQLLREELSETVEALADRSHLPAHRRKAGHPRTSPNRDRATSVADRARRGAEFASNRKGLILCVGVAVFVGYVILRSRKR